MKRQRGRGRKPGGNHHQNQPNRNFESNGPEGKVRGSASYVYEKYMQAARDSQTAGDRVLAESFLQHAEHYFRLMKAMQPAYVPQTLEQRYGPDLDDSDDEDGEGEGEGVEGAEALEGEGEMPRRRPQHERPPQEHRQRDDRHRDDRVRDDRPRDDRPRDDRPREERYRGDRRDDRGPRPPAAQATGDQPPREAGEFSAEEGAEGFRGRRRRARGRYRPGGGDAPYPAEGTDQPSTEDRAPREDAGEPRRERRERLDRPERSESGPVEGFGDGVPAFLAGD